MGHSIDSCAILAAQAKSEIPLPFALAFLGLVVCILGCFFRLQYIVAPRVVDRWAGSRGYKVVRSSLVGPFRRISTGASNTQVVYSIVIQDRGGKAWSGVLKVGSYWWPSLSTTRCPVEVDWDDGIGPAGSDFGEF